MSSYVFELSDVSIANGDNTLHINNSDSVFGAIPGSMLWIDSRRPRFVQSVDNTARTVTLTANWDGGDVVNEPATIAPFPTFAAHQNAVDAMGSLNTSAQNLLSRFQGVEANYQQYLDDNFAQLLANLPLPGEYSSVASAIQAVVNGELTPGSVVETISYHENAGVGGNRYYVAYIDNPPPGIANAATHIQATSNLFLIALNNNGLMKISQTGALPGEDCAAVWADFVNAGTLLDVDIDATFSIDLEVDISGISIEGKGALTAVSGSGADIIVTADNVTWNVKVLGNEHYSSTVTAVSGQDITVGDASVYTVNDQVIIKSDDAYQRCIWAGVVDAINGNVLTMLNNNIDGNIDDVSSGQTLRITNSSRWHGALRFYGVKNCQVGLGFSGSHRDLEFENVRDCQHGALTLHDANLVYRFAIDCVFGDVVSYNSRFYGRTLQGSRRCSLGKLFAYSPLFSGHVTKGAFECKVGDLYITNAPIMSLQVVAYNGSIPANINPELQNTLDSDDECIYGNLRVFNGGWIASIKSIPVLNIGAIKSTGAYKSFFLDVAWEQANIKSIECDSHNPDQSNLYNASALLMARNNPNGSIYIKRAKLKGIKTVSENGPLYINNIGGNVTIDDLTVEECEQTIRIVLCGPVHIKKLTTRNNALGYQVLRFDLNDSVRIDNGYMYESVNDFMDRFIQFGNTSNNIHIQDLEMIADTATVSVTDGIRIDEYGTNVNIKNVTGAALNGAAMTNTLRNTAANSNVTFAYVKALDNVVNAVSVANVTDYLSVVFCQGNIVDVTGAIAHKDVITGNLE